MEDKIIINREDIENINGVSLKDEDWETFVEIVEDGIREIVRRFYVIEKG